MYTTTTAQSLNAHKINNDQCISWIAERKRKKFYCLTLKRSVDGFKINVLQLTEAYFLVHKTTLQWMKIWIPIKLYIGEHNAEQRHIVYISILRDQSLTFNSFRNGPYYLVFFAIKSVFPSGKVRASSSPCQERLKMSLNFGNRNNYKEHCVKYFSGFLYLRVLC